MIAAIGILVAALAVGPPGNDCDARHLLAQMRQASGGDRWNGVAEIVADGTVDDAGSSGSFHEARDPKTGRSAFSESLDVGQVTYIYDGKTKWEVDQGGGVTALDAPDSAARALTTAYIDSVNFWTHPAQTRCLRPRSEDAKAFDVIRVAPPGGSAADLWVDRSTYLIDRKVEQWPTTTLTERYADYRRSDGVMLPYRVTRQYGDQSGAPVEAVERIRTYRPLTTVRETDFARPPDPPPGRISGAQASVPISVDHGVTVFDARIDGRGPFAFTLDPGAQGALTTVASTPLDLAIGKMNRVMTIQIGAASIDDIDLPVYSGAATDLFPKRSPGLSPIAGTLGPEILDRFAVRLDYTSNVMTLAPSGSLGCAGTAVAERFVLQEDDDIPLVHAMVDGHDGLFQFDLRAPASLMLFKPFLDRTGVSGSNVVRSLSIGGTTLHGVPTRFLASTAGKFSSRTEAGVLGSALLSRFVTTIDYRHRSICFERAAKTASYP
ncbi:MAG TPA: hypothetical protein VFO25_03335 [Candidatus Eremiobacteraceae bacterium]|nr:hypothetical protein [Candidatus Eremiobacteraceae bacterium]